MKVGAITNLPDSGDELGRRARLMDKSGLDSLWTYETYFAAESFSRAGFIAACTENVKIVSGVVNPYSRHPGMIALGAATLDRLSNGRLILVVGAGGKEWTESILGYRRKKPVSDVAISIEVVRKLLAGGRVSAESAGFSINGAQLDEPPIRPSIPIYVAAERQSMMKTAAKVGDGVWLFQMPSMGYVRWACDNIRKVRNNNGHIEVGTVFPIRITDEPTKELKELKPWMAFYLSLPQIGEQYLLHAGYDSEILAPIRSAMMTDKLQNPHDAFKVGNVAEAITHVPNELMDDCTIIGDVAKCREKLAAIEKAGLTFVVLSFQSKFDETIGKLNEVLPS